MGIPDALAAGGRVEPRVPLPVNGQICIGTGQLKSPTWFALARQRGDRDVLHAVGLARHYNAEAASSNDSQRRAASSMSRHCAAAMGRAKR